MFWRFWPAPLASYGPSYGLIADKSRFELTDIRGAVPSAQRGFFIDRFPVRGSMLR
jgi:hypothetical protein